MDQYTLEQRIESALQYSKRRKHNYFMTQNYLADACNRFIYPCKSVDKTTLIEIIKIYGFDEELQYRFKEIVNKFNIVNMNENTRLMLIKAIYMEKKLKIKLIDKSS
jgi:hypothetical protein